MGDGPRPRGHRYGRHSFEQLKKKGNIFGNFNFCESTLLKLHLMYYTFVDISDSFAFVSLSNESCLAPWSLTTSSQCSTDYYGGT